MDLRLVLFFARNAMSNLPSLDEVLTHVQRNYIAGEHGLVIERLQTELDATRSSLTMALEALLTSRWRMQKYKMTTVEVDNILFLNGVDYTKDVPRIDRKPSIRAKMPVA